MIDFELKRMEFTSTETMGILLIDRQIQGPTLEPPKKGNSTNISCIPTGQYKIKTYESRKFQRVCIKLYDVWNREYISMHVGNTHKNTLGCILVGTGITRKRGNISLVASITALKLITDKLAGEDGLLTITENF